MFEAEDIFDREGKEPFRIQDMSQLDWAFKVLAEVKAQDNQIKQRAEAQRDKINRWEEEEREKKKNDIQYFESIIREFHERELARDPKNKTLSTPFGKSKTRVSNPQPDKSNEQEMLQHILDNGMDEFVKSEMKWGEFKKTLKIVEHEGKKRIVDENGEEVPGAIIKPKTISYSVEITE